MKVYKIVYFSVSIQAERAAFNVGICIVELDVKAQSGKLFSMKIMHTILLFLCFTGSQKLYGAASSNDSGLPAQHPNLTVRCADAGTHKQWALQPGLWRQSTTWRNLMKDCDVTEDVPIDLLESVSHQSADRLFVLMRIAAERLPAESHSNPLNLELIASLAGQSPVRRISEDELKELIVLVDFLDMQNEVACAVAIQAHKRGLLRNLFFQADDLAEQAASSSGAQSVPTEPPMTINLSVLGLFELYKKYYCIQVDQGNKMPKPDFDLTVNDLRAAGVRKSEFNVFVVGPEQRWISYTALSNRALSSLDGIEKMDLKDVTTLVVPGNRLTSLPNV